MKKLLAVLLSLTLLCGAAPLALAENAVKDETVYVLAAPDGAARRILVSDWLSNPEGAAEIADVTWLIGVENVKGEQAFEDGFWAAEGEDIYYQGESTEPLPVLVKITYTLDGQEIAPEELAGKDGHAVIRFEYAVEETCTAQIAGQSEQLALPFAVMTGVLLENDVFANVKAVNGRVVNDGDHTIVLGLALPGMQKNLDVDPETLTIPEYVEIEADVKGFALPVTVTAASCEPFAKLDASRLDDADDLKDAVAELADGMAQLLDGSARLSDGLGELSEGADQLADGLNALSDGLDALTANNETLTAGAAQIFDALLATANRQLAAADEAAPTLTVENYDETLAALIAAMSEESISAQARAQVEQAVRAKEEQVRAAVEAAVREEVTAQVEQAVQQGVLAQVLAEAGMMPESYAAARQSGQISDAQVEQIEGVTARQMASDEVKALIAQNVEAQTASDDVQTLIAQNTEAQVQQLIDQNMQSEDVQSQIAQNVELYQATRATLASLREQLGGYATFYEGLLAYTEGAASAATGAAQLKDGVPALQDGVAQLLEGAQSMQDGLQTFSEEGVEKLDTLVNEDMDALIARVRAMIQAAGAYSNYSGIADGTSGAVRFIWRTDAIEP